MCFCVAFLCSTRCKNTKLISYPQIGFLFVFLLLFAIISNMSIVFYCNCFRSFSRFAASENRNDKIRSEGIKTICRTCVSVSVSLPNFIVCLCSTAKTKCRIGFHIISIFFLVSIFIDFRTPRLCVSCAFVRLNEINSFFGAQLQSFFQRSFHFRPNEINRKTVQQ